MAGALTKTFSVILRVCEVALVAICIEYFYTHNGFVEKGIYNAPFNLHMALMILAFPVLMSEAVVAWVTFENVLGVSHSGAKGAHVLLNLCATLCVGGGAITIFLNHQTGYTNHPAFYSAHSWMGAFTFALLLVTLAIGTVFYGAKKGSETTRRDAMPLKRALGFATWGCGVATCMMGAIEKQGFLPKVGGDVPSFYSTERMIMAALAPLMGLICLSVSIIVSTGKTPTPKGGSTEAVYFFDQPGDRATQDRGLYYTE